MKTDLSVRRSIPNTAEIDSVALGDGWKVRRFRQNADQVPPRGSILFQGGRGDFFEKYLESFDHWHRAGWNIESFDWRGQGGSGRLVEGANTGHISDYSIWIEDLEAYYADWAACTPGPHILMAHSMGGQIVMRTLGQGKVKPDAVVLIAPMLGFRNFVPNSVGQRVASFMSRVKTPESAGWRYSEKPGEPESRRSLLLTKSVERYADEQYWWEQHDNIRTGPASWQWIAASYRSMQLASQPDFLKKVTVPMLILSAGHDQLVDPAAIRHAVRYLPHVRFHEYGAESAHEILREADAVRNDALKRIDNFLAETTSASQG